MDPDRSRYDARSGRPAAASAHAIQPLAHAAVIGSTPGNIPELVEIVDGTAADVLRDHRLPDRRADRGALSVGARVRYIVHSNVLGNGLKPTRSDRSSRIHLSAPLPERRRVLVLATPTSLPSIQLASSQPPAETPAIIYGWGEPVRTAAWETTASGPTVIQPDSYCIAAVGSDYWGSSDMCAQNYPAHNTAIGFGDSGGPLSPRVSKSRSITGRMRTAAIRASSRGSTCSEHGSKVTSLKIPPPL